MKNKDNLLKSIPKKYWIHVINHEKEIRNDKKTVRQFDSKWACVFRADQ